MAAGTFTAVGDTTTLTVTTAGQLVRIWVDGVDCAQVTIDPEGAGEDFRDVDPSPNFFPYASSNTKVDDIFTLTCVKMPLGVSSIRYRID